MTTKETKQMVLAGEDCGGDGVETPLTQPKSSGADVVSVKCECCGLTEECTEAYISRVRERYNGRWICGLCGEAVKDEIARSERRIGAEEALNRHMNFCKKFKALKPPSNPTKKLISAIKQLMLRSLDSPRSNPTKKELVRSHSCVSAFDA